MQKVLVLNFDYSPLNVTSLQRGFTLVVNGKAEVIKSADNPITTFTNTYVRPLIIRLLKYIHYRSSGLRVNRQRIFKRDGNECGYCGSKKDLTIDHVLPRSKGGKNTWENLVTCCSKCNLKKGNRTPDEARMPLRKKPYEPNFVDDASTLNEAWDSFKKTFFY
jgi:5-methylcytosine-specific restriction endonuclease McrA